MRVVSNGNQSSSSDESNVVSYAPEPSSSSESEQEGVRQLEVEDERRSMLGELPFEHETGASTVFESISERDRHEQHEHPQHYSQQQLVAAPHAVPVPSFLSGFTSHQPDGSHVFDASFFDAFGSQLDPQQQHSSLSMLVPFDLNQLPHPAQPHAHAHAHPAASTLVPPVDAWRSA